MWPIVRKVLFLFDAESVHHATCLALRFLARVCPWLLRIVSGTRGPAKLPPTRAFGLEFSSPVGLAAGFDKDARLLEALPHLGFGFAEIGTVTPKAQAGNPRPRLFRDASKSAVFNRMGFNNGGAEAAAERVRRAKPRLPKGFQVGVNVGKNKDTPLEEAPRDYALAAAPFRGLADYLVINVSSPNTPGLRSLQTAGSLRGIVSAVLAEISSWPSRPPLLVKLAPEVRGEALDEALKECERLGVSGILLTNTLQGQWTRGVPEPLPGGWSGLPLTGPSLESLEDARARTRLPIVSVGGILAPEDASRRMKAGASLIQLYSGWILGGPRLPSAIRRRLDTERSGSVD